MTSHVRAVVIGIVVSMLGACVQSDYEYFDFSGSMKVVEEGVTSLRVVRHRPMPIRYVLAGNAFELEALIDTATILPSVIIVARGADGEDLLIGMVQQQCHISEATITMQERKSRALPTTAMRFEWNWANEINCTDQSGEQRTGELPITIYLGDNKQLQQSLRFEIRKNGLYIELDAL